MADFSKKRNIGATGAQFETEQYKRVIIPFGKYEIVARLTEDNRLIDIVELRIKQDFLSPEQRVSTSGYLDVDEFYQE